MYGIWSKLGIVSVRDSMMPTSLLLCENVEKLEAAVALRELHASNHKMLDVCIRKALKKRGCNVPTTLTPQDVFYREVSDIHDIIQILLNYEQEELCKEQESSALIDLIFAVNSILEGMLSRALHYRQTKAEMYASYVEDSEGLNQIPEYIPWTATTTAREVMSKQIALTLERAVSEARKPEIQVSLGFL